MHLTRIVKRSQRGDWAVGYIHGVVCKTASPLNSVSKSSIPGVTRKIQLVAGIYYGAR